MSHQLAIEHDVIGVGFGPSNLALAIALDECAKRSRLKCAPLFVEKLTAPLSMYVISS